MELLATFIPKLLAPIRENVFKRSGCVKNADSLSSK